MGKIEEDISELNNKYYKAIKRANDAHLHISAMRKEIWELMKQVNLLIVIAHKTASDWDNVIEETSTYSQLSLFEVKDESTGSN